jgi:hypothetical protein
MARAERGFEIMARTTDPAVVVPSQAPVATRYDRAAAFGHGDPGCAGGVDGRSSGGVLADIRWRRNSLPEVLVAVRSAGSREPVPPRLLEFRNHPLEPELTLVGIVTVDAMHER